MSLNTSVDSLPAAAHPRTARRLVGWRSALVLSLGSPLLITVSLGPMTLEMGAASTVVWIFTALVGFVQCLMLAELGMCFPNKVGGAPSYCHEGLKRISPLFGSISAWSYWIGWIPGVAVNLLLAATYIKAAFLPEINVVTMAIALVVTLYALNYLGLHFGTWTAAVLAVCTLVPLIIVVSRPIVELSSWHWDNFVPLSPTAHHSWSGTTLRLWAKWMFVAVWSSYGGEMITTVNGELRNPKTDIPKTAVLAAMLTTAAFSVVPLVLVGCLGSKLLADDPYVMFLTAIKGALGGMDSMVVSIMLIAALILSAQLFIISSSRALYQMGLDGMLISSFGKSNRFGAPIGGMGWDLLVTVTMLLIFKGEIVNVVAAANVGYLLVFVLLPLSYVLISFEGRKDSSNLTLSRRARPFVLAIMMFNAFLLVIGGMQWGAKIIGIGAVMVLTFIPFCRFPRRTAAL